MTKVCISATTMPLRARTVVMAEEDGCLGVKGCGICRFRLWRVLPSLVNVRSLSPEDPDSPARIKVFSVRIVTASAQPARIARKSCVNLTFRAQRAPP